MKTMFEYLQQKIKKLTPGDEEMTPRSPPTHKNTAARKNEKRNRGNQTTPASVGRPPQKKQQSQALAEWETTPTQLHKDNEFTLTKLTPNKKKSLLPAHRK